MRVLVTGSRRWTRRDIITQALDLHLQALPDLYLIVGDCPTGADRMAREWALANGVWLRQFVAHWDEMGKQAGPERNQRMVDAGADRCLAFPLGESRGTWDCVRRAERDRIRVHVFEVGAA